MHHQGNAVSWLVGDATMAVSIGSGAAVAVFIGNMARWSWGRKPEHFREVTGRPAGKSGLRHE